MTPSPPDGSTSQEGAPGLDAPAMARAQAAAARRSTRATALPPKPAPTSRAPWQPGTRRAAAATSYIQARVLTPQSARSDLWLWSMSQPSRWTSPASRAATAASVRWVSVAMCRPAARSPAGSPPQRSPISWQPDRAFQWLNRGLEESSLWPLFLKSEPLLDGLRPDPRFADLLKRAGLGLGLVVAEFEAIPLGEWR